MAHAQFVCHQLVGMLAVGFAKVLVQHNTVDNGATSVHTINQQECQPCDVTCLHNQQTQYEKQNKCYTHATYITSKTLSFVLWSEVEIAEHQHRKYDDYNQAFFYENALHIQKKQTAPVPVQLLIPPELLCFLYLY